jgi:integrase
MDAVGGGGVSSEEFPTNVDWQDFLKHANQFTAVKYEQVIVEYALYCSTNKKVLTCPLSVKMFLSHCHNTPKICKRDNKRYEHVVGQMYPQLTAELYSKLSAIKKYFECFNLKDPSESAPSIKINLAMWIKDDPKARQSPPFEDEEVEDFIAYAENSYENIIAKVAVLIYLHCAGRKGELNDITWENMKKVDYKDSSLWLITYHKEKQGGRPELSQSLLGDEISNLVFNLYANCFKEEEKVGKFFRKLMWDNKKGTLRATKMHIGKSTLSEYPRTIAHWHGKDNAAMFTNHSVRRTAATRMAENGATVIEIQVAGGWKSEKVAKSYINKSMKMKVR